MRIVAVAGLTCALAVTAPAQTAAEKKAPASTAKATPSKSGSKASSAHPKAPASAHPKAPAGAHAKAPASAHAKAAASAHPKASSKHGKTTAKRGGKKSSSKAAWRSRQLAPTPDRYKDIQSALATRGYLKQAPTGAWDAASADALRHFQQDQNLEPSGKLNSLSLIALGLGAKRGDPAMPAGAKPAAITPQTPRLQSPEPQRSPGVTPSSPAQTNPTEPSPPTPPTAEPF